MVFFIFPNSEDLDQTPHFVVSDLGMHCLPMPINKAEQNRTYVLLMLTVQFLVRYMNITTHSQMVTIDVYMIYQQQS